MKQIKILLLIGFVLLMGLFLLLFLIISGGGRETGTGGAGEEILSEPAIPLTITLFPTPTTIPVQFTGDSNEDLSAEERDGINQANTLRKRSPFTNENGFFVVVFDYNDGLFKVDKTQEGLGQAEFFDWLTQSEYKNIPRERFKF